MIEARSSSHAALFSKHFYDLFKNRIHEVAILAVGATLVLVTGCESTGNTGFAARLISPVADHQPPANPVNDIRRWPARSPAFDPDLFGS